MKNNITDLRTHLFTTLEALTDKEHPMEIERARVIAEVSQVIVNSAKVEVFFMREFGIERGTGFLPEKETPEKRLAALAAGRRGDG